MLGKLIKHEFRATGRLMAPLFGALLLLAVFARVTNQILQQVPNPTRVLYIVSVLLAIVYVLAGLGVMVFSTVLMIKRFHQNFLTDEGYLTFTLTVTTHEILLSSLINTFLGVLLMVVVACVSLGGLLLLGFSVVEGFWPALWELLPRLLQDVANSLTGELLGYGLMMLLAGTLGFICEIILLMLCITIGAMVAKKHKLLAAVGAYYGIQVAVSIVEAVFLASQVVRVVGEANIFFRVFGMNSILMLILSLLSYFGMYYLTDRKLNLI